MAADESVPNPQAPDGDTAGFAAMVETHWTPVYRFLLCLTGHVHDAEELTQETFLRAWRRLDSFRTGTRIRSWLLQIAANAQRDVQRRKRRAKFVPLEVEPEVSGQPLGQALETAEQCDLLKAAMEELPETTRSVFHLRVQEELSFREIASLLDTSEEAARWHMHQARTKLLKRMRRQG